VRFPLSYATEKTYNGNLEGMVLSRLCPIIVGFLLLALAGCQNGKLNPTGTSFPGVSEVEIASFNLLNQDRREQGLPELAFDSQVAAVARRHSEDMRDRNYFGHTNPDGKTFSDRLRAAGIPFQTSGENLVTTSNIPDPAGYANTGFLNHAEHRAIIMSGTFTRVGVGVARSGDSYWITQDFVGP